MINGLVAHVELEHEIVKWISSTTNSLALICNTVHKRCGVASNGTGLFRVTQRTHKYNSNIIQIPPIEIQYKRTTSPPNQ